MGFIGGISVQRYQNTKIAVEKGDDTKSSVQLAL